MNDEELSLWNRERDRLQLTVAAAVTQLWAHMGNPESICLPWNGEFLVISKAKSEDLR
jgi:hypothetical protein